MTAAPFGTVAPADAMRNAVEPAPALTPAQRHVARAILGFDRGCAMRSNATLYDGFLISKVAQELVDAGLATSAPFSKEATTYRLTREAAAAALEPGELLSFRAFPPSSVITGGHPSNHF